MRLLKLSSPMMYGEDIKELQGKLNSLKNLRYYCGNVDGYFGNKTDSAVRNLQRDKVLVVDGVVGEKTWNALNLAITNNSGTLIKLTIPIAHGKEAGYIGDTGLDIAAPKGTVCYAAASGTIIYSEYGHTAWQNPPDTPYSILIKLDAPITLDGRTANYIWYTHLSELKYNISEGSRDNIHVNAGDIIGKSGIGNNNAHLHFGVIINRAQNNPNDYFSIDQIRRLLNLSIGQNF